MRLSNRVSHSSAFGRKLPCNELAVALALGYTELPTFLKLRRLSKHDHYEPIPHRIGPHLSTGDTSASFMQASSLILEAMASNVNDVAVLCSTRNETTVVETTLDLVGYGVSCPLLIVRG